MVNIHARNTDDDLFSGTLVQFRDESLQDEYRCEEDCQKGSEECYQRHAGTDAEVLVPPF